MEGRKTVLILANGFGMEAKDSYSLGDDLIPTVTRLSQEYMFTGLQASGKECGFTKNQVSTFQTGYSCFATGGYVDLAVRSMDKRILDGSFIDEKMLSSIEFAVRNKSKMHIFFMIGDKFSFTTGDQLSAFVKKCMEMKVKEVCIHLFIGYNSERGLQEAKESIKTVTRITSSYENVNISLIVGVDLVNDTTPITNLSKLYQMATTGIGEVWTDWQQFFDTKYKSGTPDELITPFLIRRRVLFESNDSIFIFNYEPMPITKYLSIIINPKQLYSVDTNPTNIKVTSLLPIQPKTALSHVYEYDLPESYFAKDLEKLNKKVTLIADSSRANYINTVLNGNRNELSPYLNTKSVRINNDYFAEMTQILFNEIQNGQNDFIIIDYDLLHGYRKGDIEKLKFNFKQMDQALRKLYEYMYTNHHMLIFTSLYGVKDQIEVDGIKQMINYANRVPFIVVDNIYSRNTAKTGNFPISFISQTVLYLLGDRKKNTIIMLNKRHGKGPLNIIIVAICLFIIAFCILKLFV